MKKSLFTDLSGVEYKHKLTFTEKINELPFLNKQIKIQELNTVLTKLGLSDMINDEQVQLKIGKTVDYVLKQSPAFIELYIKSFSNIIFIICYIRLNITLYFCPIFLSCPLLITLWTPIMNTSINLCSYFLSSFSFILFTIMD